MQHHSLSDMNSAVTLLSLKMELLVLKLLFKMCTYLHKEELLLELVSTHESDLM